MSRGKQLVAIDLKKEEGVRLTLKLIKSADALIEGFRPGIMEKLGLGPKICLKENPKLVYGRMTGWGQEGPLANLAGHDINYLALTGALNSIARKGSNPTPPLNLVGDFGGGGMYLAFGLVCALIETSKSKMGQVVDAAEPPLRVFFGELPLELARADYESRLATWEKWQPVAVLAQG